MERVLMFKATEYNWGLKGPGDWNNVTWEIYYDKTYSFIVKNNPVWNPEMDKLPELEIESFNGEMEELAFAELSALLETEQWRTPGRIIQACDGVAWEMKYYSTEGKLLNSSGKLDYIYGEKVLEDIARVLPRI